MRTNEYRIRRGLTSLAVVCLLVGGAAGCGESSSDGAAEPEAETSAPEEESVPTVTFLGEEAHSELPTEPGCDQISFHSTMAMFDPTLADELIDLECPFPFDPETVGMEGGEEDPSIQAPYEPRHYADVFDVLNELEYGICSVGRVNEPSVEGFVYGFTVSLQSESCADGVPGLGVNIREYASRAHRDASANAERDEETLVLGRFVITIDAPADDAAAISTKLVAEGAEVISG